MMFQNSNFEIIVTNLVQLILFDLEYNILLKLKSELK